MVLIKLAERTQTMRCLSGASAEQQQRIARETRGIFAPLANRLGVWQVKWELEDLSLRYLEPELYKKVAELLDERRLDREQYIADLVALLQQELRQADVKAKVTGRSKHIYSIINKMKRKQVDFSELYDVRAVRILVGGTTRRGEASGAGVPPCLLAICRYAVTCRRRTISRVVTRRSVWCTICGSPFPRSSTITSRIPRATIIAPCIRR